MGAEGPHNELAAAWRLVPFRGGAAFGKRPSQAEDPSHYLVAVPPHIPSDAAWAKELAAKATSGVTGDRERAQAMFRCVRGRLQYSTAGRKPSHLPFTPDETLARGAGQCVDQMFVYVTLCRAAGIPARCGTGVSKWGVHNWASVYLDGEWVPVDTSRGRFGSLDDDVGHRYDDVGDGIPTSLAGELWPTHGEPLAPGLWAGGGR